MKVYIIGAGAIGKALAVCLKTNGKEVELVRGSVDDGNCHDVSLTLKFRDGKSITADVRVNTLSNLPKLAGLIVLTNKSFGNRNLAEKLKGKTGSYPIVLMQNGLGVEQPFTENGFKEIYRCVLFATSQVSPTGEISYKPVADSPIGVVDQNECDLEEVVRLLDTPEFRFVTEANIEKIVWKKAIANCVFNSICPLLEVDNGIFYRDETAFVLAKRVISECIHISKEKGIDLEAEEIEEQVLAISKMSDGQFISTLQDIRNHKETEIDTLNFEVYRMAKSMKLEERVKETRLLGDLVKLKSELNR